MKKTTMFALVAVPVLICVAGVGALETSTVTTLKLEPYLEPSVPRINISVTDVGNSANYSVISSFLSGSYWVNLTSYSNSYNDILGIGHYTITKSTQKISFLYTDISLNLRNVSISLSNKSTGITENFSSVTYTSNPFSNAQSLKYDLMVESQADSIALIFKPSPMDLEEIGDSALLTLHLSLVVYSDFGPFHTSGKLYEFTNCTHLHILR